MKALFFRTFGGPEVLEYGEVADPPPRAGHAIVRTSAIGLNFADVYRRRGNYHLVGKPPYIAGYEAAGTIESLADDAPSWLHAGMRVGFADSPHANAELVSVQYDKLIPLPDDVNEETAAALLLQGLTAQFLCSESYAVHPGDRVVVHAAAGGVGLLLVQMLKAKGAHVISFASTDLKRRAAESVGADEVHGYESWPAAAQKADAIFDSVGTTLRESIASVRTGGTVVFYGFAGGDPPPIDARTLMDGSKRLVGGDLWNVLTSHDERVQRASELFAYVRQGKIRPLIARRFPLADGADAHRLIESRAVIGKVLLLP
jgi:NADPH2:quinone reductase